jgi:hypothetical protein
MSIWFRNLIGPAGVPPHPLATSKVEQAQTQASGRQKLDRFCAGALHKCMLDAAGLPRSVDQGVSMGVTALPSLVVAMQNDPPAHRCTPPDKSHWRASSNCSIRGA